MKFSWSAFIFAILFVAISGVVSYSEGTFSSKTGKKVTMGFIEHGGMISDFFIVPMILGIIYPYILPVKLITVAMILIIAFIISLIAHLVWGIAMYKENVTGHIFPVLGYSLSNSGILHVGFMTMTLATLGYYLITPMPKSVILLVSSFLVMHVIIGTIQPEWQCHKKITEKSMIPAAILCFIVWTVALLKT